MGEARPAPRGRTRTRLAVRGDRGPRQGRELLLTLLRADGDQAVALLEREPCRAADRSSATRAGPPARTCPVSVSRRSSFRDRPVGRRASLDDRPRRSSPRSPRARAGPPGAAARPARRTRSCRAPHRTSYSDAAPRRSRPRSSSGSRASGAARRTQDSSSSCRMSLTSLERADLGGERAVVEQQRRVREPDRRLGEVLHLHEDVHRPVELRERRRSSSGASGSGGAPASSRTWFTPSSGPRTRRTSPSDTTSSAPGSNSPVHAAADRHHPHAGLGGEREVAERAAGRRARRRGP